MFAHFTGESDVHDTPAWQTSGVGERWFGLKIRISVNLVLRSGLFVIERFKGLP